MNSTAYISNSGEYIVFTHNNRTIRFKGPKSLESIREVKEWDNGYLVVDAKYNYSNELVEDYIDFKQILRDLYQDDVRFLMPIKNVEVKNV